MFCQNCGKEIDDKAVVCVGCGVSVNPIDTANNQTTTSEPKKGKGIASMILGIIALFFVLICFSSIDVAVEDVAYESFAFKFGYIIGFNLFSFVPAVVGLCLACSERKKHHNGFNTSGFWMTLISIVLIAVISIYILIA